MAKKPKCASRMLAFLMAVVMMAGSVPTAYASDATPISVSSGSSTIIDDPVSGSTGSGWDNIDGGGPVTEPPEEGGEDGNTSRPEEGGEDSSTSEPEEGGEDGNTSEPEEGGEDGNTSKPEDGSEDGNTSKPEEGGEGENTSKPEEGGEDGNTSKPEEGNGSLPETPENGVINGTELPWAANLRAAAEATMAMPMPLSPGDEGGGSVEFTHYGWGDDSGGGMNAVWMGSEPNGSGWYFADVYRSTYDGADAFCGEFNGQMPGGNYVRGAEGSDEQIKKIIASYEKSGKGRGDYIAAQALIWAELLGTTVNYWGTSGANESLLYALGYIIKELSTVRKALCFLYLQENQRPPKEQIIGAPNARSNIT